MKRVFTAITVLSIAFSCLAGCGIENTDPYETTAYTEPVEILLHGYTFTDLNVYAQPDNSSEIYGQLPLGSYIQIEMIQGNWCRISGGWLPLEGVYYRQIGTAWPAIMEGYVRPDHTTLLKTPDANSESTATYYNGDSVLICLVAGKWGLTQNGWIYLDHVNITKTYSEEDYQPTEPQTVIPRPTVPQQTENDSQTQDKSYLLEGTWYYYRIYEKGKSYYVYSKEFRDGLVLDNDYIYHPETGKRSFIGNTEGLYSFDGNKVWIDCPPYTNEGGNKYSIRVTGNTMYWDWGSEEYAYQRVSWETIKAQIDKAFKGSSGATEKPGTTVDTAIVGSWYRYIHYDGQDECFVIVKNFKSSGVCSEKTYTYNPSDPNSFHCSNSLEYGYTFEYNGSIIYNRYDSPSDEYAEVIGNTLKLSESDGINTYYKGTVEDGLAALKASLKEQYIPTQPTEKETEPTEAATTVPQTEPTEATTEPQPTESVTESIPIEVQG